MRAESNLIYTKTAASGGKTLGGAADREMLRNVAHGYRAEA
jgi:hypothetical protein